MDKLAYLLGALRDATTDIRVGKNYEVKIGQKDVSWLQFLQSIFKELFDYGGNITPHGEYSILRITTKAVVLRIVEVSEIEVPQGSWETPSIVHTLPEASQIDYVRGFWDAEGGLPKTTKQTYISFDQKNRPALEFIRNILTNKVYHPTKITLTGKCWQFRLTRKKELARYFQEIGTCHSEKRKRFQKMLTALFP
jgi:hypothetical protein